MNERNNSTENHRNKLKFVSNPYSNVYQDKKGSIFISFENSNDKLDTELLQSITEPTDREHYETVNTNFTKIMDMNKNYGLKIKRFESDNRNSVSSNLETV
jgi:hypothetical protein